jgi:hypothetical protein
MPVRHAAPFVLASLLATGASAQSTLTVTSTADSGPGTLRQALLDAASAFGADIEFAIPGEGVKTIAIQSPLVVPALTNVDGSTQPGADCNEWPPTLLVEIDGSGLPPATDAIHVVGDDAVVRGLVVNDATGDGIRVGEHGYFWLSCSFVGTDPTGGLDHGNAGHGVHLVGSSFALIGGFSTSDRNLVSGNAGGGIEIDATAATNAIWGNYVGTTADGLSALANGHGIGVAGPANSLGGPTAEASNLIAGNTLSGIELGSATASENEVFGNVIGENAAGAELGNGGAGVKIEAGAGANLIGVVGAGNRIAWNQGGGVTVAGATTLGNAIGGNSMEGNTSIGIDLLGTAGESPNDPGDPDAGPNRLQNTPVLSAVSFALATNTLTVTYDVDTAPANAAYPLNVDFYRADAGGEEGVEYLATAIFTEESYGAGGVEAALDALGSIQVGQSVVATATDAAGNTSEFCADAAIVTAPEAAGGALAALAALAVLAGRRREERTSPDAI